MKDKKMSFNELANKAQQVGKEELSKVVGGRRNRDGVSSWSWDRGGIIDDDTVIRFEGAWPKKG